MESNDTEIKPSGGRQIVFLILLAIAIGVLIFTSIVLVRNAEEIRSDPVQYAISNDFYDSCSCFKEGSGVRNFGEVVIRWNEEAGDLKLDKQK